MLEIFFSQNERNNIIITTRGSNVKSFMEKQMKVKVVEFFAAVKELQLHQVDDRPGRLALYNFLLRGG